MRKQAVWMMLVGLVFAAGGQNGTPVEPAGLSLTAEPTVVNRTALAQNETKAQFGQRKIKVLYAGDSGIVMGPHIIASPFNSASSPESVGEFWFG